MNYRLYEEISVFFKKKSVEVSQKHPKKQKIPNMFLTLLSLF